MKAMQTDQLTGTIKEFHSLFPGENEVIDFLFGLRWPEGFICPSCRGKSPGVHPARTFICPKCGNLSSLTTGTIMHGTKKNLSQWLLAIWWLSANEKGASARELQRLLELSSYQTAWTWLQKLRMAISFADREPCKGVVELGCSEVSPAWERHEEALVFTAAEFILPLGVTGRIRMSMAFNCSEKAMIQFLQKAVKEKSSLIAPGFAPFSHLEQSNYSYIIDSKTEIPKRIEEINSSFEIWLHKIHRGGVSLKHLQLYLDEFCFHNNASLMPNRHSIFMALVQGVLEATPTSYKEIVKTGTGENRK